MSTPDPTLFISYRHKDSQAWAGWIANYLRERSNFNVLIDVHSIEPGVNYTQAIADQISEAGVVLVVIGPDWLDAADAEGERRLFKDNDPVRLEIETALNQGKRVVPVLVEGAAMPERKELPTSIAEFAFHNGLSVTHEALERQLDQLVADLAPLGASPSDLAGSTAPSVDPVAVSTGPLLLTSPRRRALATLIDLFPLLVGTGLLMPFLDPSPDAKILQYQAFIPFPHDHPVAQWYATPYFLGIGFSLTLCSIALAMRRGRHRGQTLGKQICGHMAVAQTGQLSWHEAGRRELLKLLSILAVVPVWFLQKQVRSGEEGRTWIDKICETTVVVQVSEAKTLPVT